MKKSILIAAFIFILPAFAEPGRSNVHYQLQMHHLSNISKSQNLGSLSLGTIYLDNGVVRVGIKLDWGGGISEIVYQGKNIVNDADTGRLIQLSLYDGGDYYPPSDWGDPDYGWNPVQGGDKYGHGSGVISFSQSGSTIYTKCKPYEWNPDNKGGGPSWPVRSDCYYEQWVSLDQNIKELIKITYKLTHFGADEHLLAGQEFPCVYVNSEFNRMITYEGMSPWTNDAVSEKTMPVFPGTIDWYSPEYWGAAVNSENLGLTIYTAWQNCYPGYVGTLIPDAGTNYYRPTIDFSIGKNEVFCATVYLVVGNYAQSREKIYALHQTEPATVKWEFNRNFSWAEGWSPWNQLAPFRVSNGTLKTLSAGNDPYMGYIFDINIPAELCPGIQIRMKVSAGNEGDIYFITQADTDWDENKKLPFMLKPGNYFETYLINTNNCPFWVGTIKQFRLDPTDSESKIEIDYIRIRTLFTVTTPNASSFWQRATTQTITWTKVGPQAQKVNIRLFRNNVYLRDIALGTPNDGSFDWKIPAGIKAQSGYVVRVKATDGTVGDDSEQFTVTAPTITITSPAAGNVWTRGSQHTITWTKTGIQDDEVKILLMRNGYLVRSLSLNSPNSGTFDWSIPTNIAVGSGYYVRVRTLDGVVFDDSDRFAVN